MKKIVLLIIIFLSLLHTTLASSEGTAWLMIGFRPLQPEGSLIGRGFTGEGCGWWLADAILYQYYIYLDTDWHYTTDYPIVALQKYHYFIPDGYTNETIPHPLYPTGCHIDFNHFKSASQYIRCYGRHHYETSCNQRFFFKEEAFPYFGKLRTPCEQSVYIRCTVSINPRYSEIPDVINHYDWDAPDGVHEDICDILPQVFNDKCDSVEWWPSVPISPGKWINFSLPNIENCTPFWSSDYSQYVIKDDDKQELLNPEIEMNATTIDPGISDSGGGGDNNDGGGSSEGISNTGSDKPGTTLQLAKLITIEKEREQMKKSTWYLNTLLAIMKITFSFILLLFYLFSFLILIYVFTNLTPKIFNKSRKIFKDAFNFRRK